MAPREGGHPHGAVFEGLNNGCDRIQHHDPLLVGGDGAQRIYDRRGVHPQLYNKAEQKGEVAVFRGHRGDQDSKPQGQSGQHQDQHRNQQDIHGRVNLHPNHQIVKVHGDKQEKLDAHPHQVGADRGQGYDKPRKIDLAKDPGIGGEGRRGLVQAIGKVLPADYTRQVKERLGEAVGGDLGDAPKHHHIHDGGQCRLNEIPQGAHDGLLILGDDVAPDKHRP